MFVPVDELIYACSCLYTSLFVRVCGCLILQLKENSLYNTLLYVLNVPPFLLKVTAT